MQTLQNEIIAMLKLTKEMLQNTHEGLQKDNKDLLNNVLKTENTVNDYEKKITGELIELSKHSEKDKRAKTLFQIIRDIERIGDHCEDLVQRIEIKIDEGLTFSEIAQNELNQLFNAVTDIIIEAINVCEKNDKTLLKKIKEEKKEIDSNVKLYISHHFDRLKKGICDPRSGMIFSDLVGILGGIAKHSLFVSESWI